jgi:arylsulfatase A-like enzyme
MTHVPLIVVWPERIAGGRRIGEPVSLIDLLPTILELAGLPPPDPVAQGRSLASALFGREDWKPTPVILDQFNVDPKTGVPRGNIEVIDGRWGASLEIDPAAPDEDIAEDERRPSKLLLYDVIEDPHCLELVNEQRPDLVEKYTNFLLEKWTTHRELARGFTRPDAPDVTPAQLETLRALGYLP